MRESERGDHLIRRERAASDRDDQTALEVGGAVLVWSRDGPGEGELVAAVRGLGFEPVAAPGDVVGASLQSWTSARAVVVDISEDVPAGLAFCESLRRRPDFASAPLLVLLSDPGMMESVGAGGAGIDDFLLKPLSSAELGARISHQLALRARRAGVEDGSDGRPAIVELFRSLSASLDSDQVLMTVVRRVAEVTSASRCSIVMIDRESSLGFVLATHENPSLKDLVIELARYPEIGRVLKTREALAVAELTTDPLATDVREYVERLGKSSVLVVPILWEEDVLGTVLLHVRRPSRPFDAEEVGFCRLVAHAARNAIRNATLYRAIRDEKTRLEELVISDPLTRVFNRAYLEARLVEELDRAQRYDLSFAFIMIDADGFKRINDTYGHVAGDDVLRQLALAIRHESRKSDLVARYGGEEFAILLPSTNAEGAFNQAERVRVAVEKLEFAGLPDTEHLTISIGIAAFPDTAASCATDMVVAADRALYRAKREGKNRVCCLD